MVVLVGAVARAVLLRSPLGFVNSDEATSGLEAMELLRGRAWIFVPGQVYGGNLESWAAAPFEALMGASIVRLKLLTGAAWLGATLLVHHALRPRVGEGPAALAAAVIWLPSAALVQLSLSAYPGYGTGLLAAAGVVALSVRLVDHGSRPVAAAALGGLAGLAVWQHPLYLQTVVPFLVWVAWRHRRSVRTTLAPMVGGGLLGVALPIYHNLRHDFASVRPQYDYLHLTYRERVTAWLQDLLPRAVGAKWLSPEWVLGASGRLLLVLVVPSLAALCIVVIARGPSHARVAAFAALPAPFLIPLFNGAGYTLDARYAVMVLAPLALVVGYGAAHLPRGMVRPGLMVSGVVVWAVLAIALPFDRRLDDLPSDLTTDALAAELLERGITTARADYWVAHQLTYESDEAVVASPIEPVRIGYYDQIVRRAERSGEAALIVFEEQVPALLAGRHPFGRYQQYRDAPTFAVGRWIVFLPDEGGGE